MSRFNSIRMTLAGGTLAIALCAVAFPAAAGQVYNFNADWRLNVGEAAGAEAPSFSDSGWKSVTLPHTFNEYTAYKVERQPTGASGRRGLCQRCAHRPPRKRRHGLWL